MIKTLISLDTPLGYVDILTIAFDDKVKTIGIFEDDEEKTFQFVLDMAIQLQKMIMLS